jgi:hypothetical protein
MQGALKFLKDAVLTQPHNKEWRNDQMTPMTQ